MALAKRCGLRKITQEHSRRVADRCMTARPSGGQGGEDMKGTAFVRRNGLRSGASMLAIVALAIAAPAFAQTADDMTTQQGNSEAAPGDTGKKAESTTSDIVVVGVRAALENAQAIKKNAATFVDSITATDIGAFPDKSAAEALQRVPGISVNRLQSADDSTHPSGEPTQVLIRGLPF